jgi:hypothetical protein
VWFQVSSAVWMGSALFWDVTQRISVVFNGFWDKLSVPSSSVKQWPGVYLFFSQFPTENAGNIIIPVNYGKTVSCHFLFKCLFTAQSTILYWLVWLLPNQCRRRGLLFYTIALIDTHAFCRNPPEEGPARRRGFTMWQHKTISNRQCQEASGRRPTP